MILTLVYRDLTNHALLGRGQSIEILFGSSIYFIITLHIMHAWLMGIPMEFTNSDEKIPRECFYQVLLIQSSGTQKPRLYL